ncbi:hypothetical protein RN001_003561 [Aquatica leii]|uniref:Growth arrest-specific protein 2 n=1 Tax=Aquatica leii TaxID=1421715 RepID=A0AAN7PF85_9COLE|nr:hypothetical protein RN001_003561 [Aquatica leii]
MNTKLVSYKTRPMENNYSWGPNSIFSQYYYIRGVDEGYVEEYTEKVVDAQTRQLDPLKQDLAVWINRLLDLHYLNGENLFHELDNGALLCRLALVILRRAKIAVVAGYTDKSLPYIRDKYFENAMRGSFFSRDNMENFINFCRSLGVHQNLLFESDDLVLQNNPRNVILCLLEVARLSTQFAIEPPNLMQFEKEMTSDEKTSACDYQINSQMCWQFQSLPPRIECPITSPVQETPKKWTTTNQMVPYKNKINAETSQSVFPVSIVVDKQDVDTSSKSSKDDFYTYFDAKMGNDSNKSFDELDRRVEQAAQLLHCNCQCANKGLLKLKIRKIGEGRYTIAGRNVFVRLLRDRHMMVRVGGGWDTFENFLKRHDPCQADGKELKSILVTRPSTASMLPNIPKRYSYYSTFKKILRPGESAI